MARLNLRYFTIKFLKAFLLIFFFFTKDLIISTKLINTSTSFLTSLISYLKIRGVLFKKKK